MTDKKILVLFARKSVENKLCDPKALIELLNQQVTTEASFVWALFEDLVFYVTNDEISVYDARNDMPIDSYHRINLRFWGDAQGHAMALARYCHERGVQFIDGEALRPGSLNKLTQYVNLHYADIPIPRTIMGHGAAAAAMYEARGFGYPMIAKAAGGTRGQNNFLIQSASELRKLLASQELAFVLQEFIPNQGDYRVLVTGDTVRFVLHRRSASDSHLNNTSQGGIPMRVEIAQVDPEVINLSVRAAQYFSRDFAGVDIVQASDTGKFYCFEVNRSPQIEHTMFEADKAQVLADFLASD